MTSTMLHPNGIILLDKPPQVFEFGLASHDRIVRAIVPYVEAGYSDEEAFAALSDDARHLEVFRLVHGNRPTPKPRAEQPHVEAPPTLFDAA